MNGKTNSLLTSGGSGGEISPEMFGCTKMAIDTFSYSDTTSVLNVKLKHSLGEIPKVAIIICPVDSTYVPPSGNYLELCMLTHTTIKNYAAESAFCYSVWWESEDDLACTVTTSIDTQSITITKIEYTTTKFKVNTTYTIITMA